MIPFVDLKIQLDNLADDINLAMQNVLETSSFIRGPAIKEFEEDFASMMGASFVRGVGSGTDALHLAVRALGIGPGDEVITVANTWISTAFAASYVGAKVVLVDIEPNTYQISPACLEAAITPKTKAVIPVHMYGHPAPMKEILAICRPHGIKIIEDAAHAPMAEIENQRVGTIGDIGCFSFYPSKNLGCYGDGGAVVTNSPDLIETIGVLADYGQLETHNHHMIGYNSRLDTLQAAVLNAKLPHLPSWNKSRRAAAALYSERLQNLPVKIPLEATNIQSVFHLYVIEIDNRDACLKFLRENGVMAQIHYPVPIHLQPCYSELEYNLGDLPVAEAAADSILSLPIFPEITEGQIDKVVDILSTFILQN